MGCVKSCKGIMRLSGLMGIGGWSIHHYYKDYPGCATWKEAKDWTLSKVCARKQWRDMVQHGREIKHIVAN